jgi:hypothetical protein
MLMPEYWIVLMAAGASYGRLSKSKMKGNLLTGWLDVAMDYHFLYRNLRIDLGHTYTRLSLYNAAVA